MYYSNEFRLNVVPLLLAFPSVHNNRVTSDTAESVLPNSRDCCYSRQLCSCPATGMQLRPETSVVAAAEQHTPFETHFPQSNSVPPPATDRNNSLTTLCQPTELTDTVRTRGWISYLSAHTFSATGDFTLIPGNDDKKRACLKGARYVILFLEPGESPFHSRVHCFQRKVERIAQNSSQ